MGTQRGVPVKTGDVTVPTGCKAHAADEYIGASSAKAPMYGIRKCRVYLPSSVRGTSRMVYAQEIHRREGLERVHAQGQARRKSASTGQRPDRKCGEDVLLARVRQLEGAAKLVLAWTVPWRVVSGGFRHVYEV